jgi:hypothetical protein
MKGLVYENFVKGAFEFALKKPISTLDDPAKLANTDYFQDGQLARVKAAVAYSMEIFNSHIRELKPDDIDYTLMDTLLTSVISADNTEEINQLIEQYLTTIHKKYMVLL